MTGTATPDAELGSRFPAGFRWGVSTSAYQIEGGVAEGGRKPSIWDTFSHTPGRTENGDTGDVACDHYHRWREDLDLMSGLGLDTYRLSLSWARLCPDGTVPLSPAGRDFYDRIIDRLLELGIRPAVTLYHWDLPQALQDRDGWVSRDTAHRFGEYAEACFAAFGDRVDCWITQNEPWVIGVLGHQLGMHAPGETDVARSLRAIHHVLLGHGLAMRALRASGRPGRAGVAFSLFPSYPASDSEADRAAAWGSDGYANRWFLDPVFGRGYPEDTLEHYRRLVADPLDCVADGDLDVIATPSDFLGVNYYTRRVIRAVERGRDGSDGRFPWAVLPAAPGVPVSGIGWEIVPDCLTDLLVRLRRDYGDVPMLITENGGVFDTGPDDAGRVPDHGRSAFLRGHLTAVARAIQLGVPVEGYLHWSLMDNFEWAMGYGPRFGLVHVDYATQRRTVKDSAHCYARIIAGHRARHRP
ncbi:MAG: GH1 family beta-glucosidase [Actinocatenispora sp.]